MSTFHYEFSGDYISVKEIVLMMHKEKKLPSIITSSWNIAVVYFTSIIRYLCTGSIQLFRLMIHIKECICKL